MNSDPMKRELTDEQSAELDRRWDKDDAAPDVGVPRDEVKAQALARIRERGSSSSLPAEPEDDLVNGLIEHNP